MTQRLPMTQLDHIVYATADVAGAADRLGELFGVRAELGGRHLGLGTYNQLLGLGGGTYLEIIGPDPDQSPTDRPMPFGLGEGRPDRVAGFAVGVSGLAAVVESARAKGYDPGEVREMQRATPDGEVLRWQLATRFDQPFDGVVPFLIDWLDTPHPSTMAPQGCRLVELRLAHPDVAGVQAAHRALGLSLAVSGGPKATLTALIATPSGEVELH